jgi:hypothetical protein
MNLHATVSIYGGGPGSGCRGDACGRPSSGIILKNVGTAYNYGSRDIASDKYQILDEKGGKLGNLEVHLDNNGKELVVDYVSGHREWDDEEEIYKPILGDVAIVRGVAKELKKLYPSAKKISGKRITGVHNRTGNNMVSVPLHAATDLLLALLK